MRARAASPTLCPLRWAVLSALLLSATVFASTNTLGGRTGLRRFAERPVTQSGVDNSWSTLEVSFTWPANATNTLAFDYGVESEENFDYLEVYDVNAMNVATLVWRDSGVKRGHATVAMPAAGGPRKVRFRYVKDGSVSRYLDTAWVDNVELKSSALGSARSLTTFDTWGTGLPAGWASAAGGFAGVWSVARPVLPAGVSRPTAQGGQANTTSSLERTVLFPLATENYVSFDYFVDSQPGSDFLKVYVDPATNPTPVWSASGLNQGGHTLITKVNGAVIAAGPHVVRFEYAKGPGPSAGLDTARVTNVVMGSGGKVVELHTFSGRTLGGAVRVGTRAIEWTAAGAFGGWVTAPWLPHASAVPLQAVGARLYPGWSTFTEPVLDGAISANEYKNSTSLKVRNDGSPSASVGSISLSASASSSALFLSLRVPAATLAAGNESGTLVLLLDADHPRTLSGAGCGAYGQLPSGTDRKLTLSYTIGPGGSLATVTVAQQKGTCASWGPLVAGDVAWPVAVAASEPAKDLGFLHFEVSVGLPASVVGQRKVGLGVSRTNLYGAIPLVERLPYADVVQPVADTNVYSWETVNLAPELGVADRGGPSGDGCCFPTPNQPGLRW